MAKPSKLDMAIKQAQYEYDKLTNECARASAVIDALIGVRDTATVSDGAPKQKRTRKKKGLPEAAEAGK